VLSLVLASRSDIFDNWRMPTALPVMAMTSIVIVLLCIVALRRAAENSRANALADVRDATLRALAHKAASSPAVPSPEQLDLLRRQIEALEEGAFAKMAHQPLLKALMMPFATWGGTTLLDYMAMANV
jgi:hypothetical protein